LLRGERDVLCGVFFVGESAVDGHARIILVIVVFFGALLLIFVK
jgi:hypothetical protein